jgi:hypothetical protein
MEPDISNFKLVAYSLLAAVFILDKKRKYGKHILTELKRTKLVLDCRLPQEHFMVQFA